MIIELEKAFKLIDKLSAVSIPEQKILLAKGMELEFKHPTLDYTFKFDSSKNVLDPSKNEILVVGYKFYNGTPFAIGEPKTYQFEYDKEFTLNYTDKNFDANSFYDYCKQNDLIIEIAAVDKTNIDGSVNSAAVYVKYR